MKAALQIDTELTLLREQMTDVKNRERKCAQPPCPSWNSHYTEEATQNSHCTEEAMGKDTKGTCVSQPDETTGIEKQS